MTTATKYKTYSKYKPSGIDWLGDIPAGWETKKLKYGFYFTKGKNAALYTAEYNAEHAGDHPVYSGQTEGEGIMGLIDSYDYDFEKVIFTTTVGAKVMTPLLLSGKFSLSQNCLLMIKSSKQVFEKYFYYQLFPLFDREKSLVPSHMQPSLRFSDLNTFDVAYPEIDEQKSIVDFLDRETAKIDEMVAKKQKMMELLKEKRQALITHTVTRGLNPKAKMKPSGIDWLGNIPAAWEVKRLKYVALLGYGSSLPEEKRNDAGEIPVYGSNGLIGYHDQYITKKPVIVVGRKGSYGKLTWVDTECFPVDTTYFIDEASTKNNLRWVYYCLSILKLDEGSQDSAVPGLAREKVYTTMIGLPFGIDQKEMVVFLDRETAKIDEMVKKVETQIEKLQEYRQALITNAVTGKIKV